MSINKLTGDKLQRQNLFNLLTAYLGHYEKILNDIDDHTSDKELKKQVRRQLDGINTILHKAYRKSIDGQTL